METMLYGNYQRVAVDEQSAYKFGEQASIIKFAESTIRLPCPN